MTNVRLINKWRENGGEWTVRSDADMKRIQRELDAYRREEPRADWHLETRGTSASWHRWV